MHVHVGVDDPDKAIHVANGMRVHLPVLLALSANSPFWRADPTGLVSTRTPIFRAFPARRHPARLPRLGRLRAAHRVHDESRRDRGLHLPLVRRAPASRTSGPSRSACMDSQTRVEHTLGLAALIQAMVKELCEHYEAGEAALATTRTRCSTRTSGSPRATGSTASSSTCPPSERVATEALARRLCDRLREHAAGPRARRPSWRARRPARARQRRRAPGRGLRGQPRSARGRGARSCDGDGAPDESAQPAEPGPGARPRYSNVDVPRPDLFVVCKNCGSEVSPYVTECPYCGTRLRKRAPKIDTRRARRGTRRACAASGPPLRPPAAGRDPRDPRRVAAGWATIALRRAVALSPCWRGRPVSSARRRRLSLGCHRRRARGAALTAPFLYENGRLRVRRAGRDRRSSAGCSSAATGRVAVAARSSCACGGAGGVALEAPSPCEDAPGGLGAQRRRPGPAGRLGGADAARPAAGR